MCPDFTGSPFYPQNQQVKYSMAPMLPCKDFNLSPKSPEPALEPLKSKPPNPPNLKL